MSTNIEWTHQRHADGTVTKGDTWNPIIGCDKVSPGCKNCYAIQTAWIRMHNPAMKEKYAGTVSKSENGQLNWTGKVNIHMESLQKPVKEKKPTLYFVNSMSDMFHEDLMTEFLLMVWDIMYKCPWHTFQILTKRANRLEMLEEVYRILQEQYPQGIFPLKNVWIGVSVENQKYADERIPYLLKAPAAIKFLSCEPLLGPVELWNYDEGVLRGPGVIKSGGVTPSTPDEPPEGYDDSYPGIDWVICGGESGKGSRPMHPEWVYDLKRQCADASVPFFFKQWGEYANGSNGGTPVQKWFMVGNDGSVYHNDDIVPRGLNCTLMSKVGKKKSGRLLDGVEYNEMPSIA